jgi:hypothetical protein
MSQLVRAKHPNIVLGVVGAALAVPVLGITISLVGASANTPQDVSMQDVSMEENTQDEVSVQHETVPTVAATSSVVVESQPAQSPLPDPLTPAPEPIRDSAPSASVSTSVSAAQEPSSESKSTATAPKVEKVTQPVVTEQVMNESKTVKKTTQTLGGWTPPALNPGTVSLRAPQLSSDANVTLTVACSPSANCVINGDQLTMTEGTQVTVTYRAKATSTHTAWATTIRS